MYHSTLGWRVIKKKKHLMNARADEVAVHLLMAELPWRERESEREWRETVKERDSGREW